MTKPHVVTPTEQGFQVLSGRSGNTYLVVPLATGGGSCNCERARRSIAIDARCSHVLAVEAFAIERGWEQPKVESTADPFRGFREEGK